MKKLIASFLLLSVVLSLCGCFRTGPLPYDEDAFFDADLLAEYNLSDLPVPKLENSRLTGGTILYLNLTREEYEDYVARLVTYLREREDVYYLSYRYAHTLMFGAFPHETYAPLSENYDLTDDEHRLAFTYTADLNDEQMMTDPIRIEVLWDAPGMEWHDDYMYNTQISLYPNRTIPAELDRCAAEHTYDEGMAYPVPGLDRQVTVRSCIHCGEKTFSEYIGSENRKLYAVTVTEGRAHILRNNWNQVQSWDIDSMFSGQIVEITTRMSELGEVVMLVNGESIPVLWTEGITQTFGFIMPEQDVEIRIVVTEENMDE